MGLIDPRTLSHPTYVKFTYEVSKQVIDSRDLDVVMESYSVGDTAARRYEVEVPGRDGTLDLTESLGGVYFSNRQLTMRFIAAGASREQTRYIASNLRNKLDGRLVRITVSDDLAYFWRGRCQVEVEKEQMFPVATIVVTADVEPHKYAIFGSYEPWQWSPFSFVDGVVTTQDDVILNNETKTVTLPIDPARGKPVLWLNTGSSGGVRARLSTQSTWQLLRTGKNTFPEIRMSDTEQRTLVLYGKGSVGVDYRIGSL